MDTDTFLDQIVKGTLAQFREHFVTYWWPNFWPYIVGFAVFIIGGVILQIIMKKAHYRNQLSPAFNSLVGSVTYSLFFALYLFIAYKIWGVQVIDDLWFAIIGLIAFPSVWIFLRLIGFWHY